MCTDIYVVHPKNYENKYTTIQCTNLYCPRFGLSTFLIGRCFGMSTFWFGLVCRRFGLSTFWSVDALVCWCFGMSTFWFVDALVCRRFGLLRFRCVSVSVCRRFGHRRFGLSTFWPVTYKRVHFDTPKPGYKYGHHFCWFNFDALAQGDAYKPTKEPIDYRGPGGDRTHDVQTETTPPTASCPTRTLHATEIA